MYAFPNIKETGLSSNQFARKCLNEAGDYCLATVLVDMVRAMSEDVLLILQKLLRMLLIDLKIFLNKDFIH